MTLTNALFQTLLARGALPAAELLATLGTGRATLMRKVRAAGAEVVTIGRARRTAYAVRLLSAGSVEHTRARFAVNNR